MTQTFRQSFGREPNSVVKTPGRVNLLGEWVDFSGGLVLPMALPLQVTVALSTNGTDEDVVASAQFDELARFPLTAGASGHWSDYVRGSLQMNRAVGLANGGYNVALESDVPHGSGLSTSAAVCVATLIASGGEARQTDLVKTAQVARRVENEFIGVPCGIMDQMAVALAEPGKVLALETGGLSYELIDLPDGWHVSVVHSGVSRELADGRYKERREECLQAAAALGVEELCRAELSAAEALEGPLKKRARHVIAEDRRTRAALVELKSGNLRAFGDHLNAGHASIRDDFEITTPEVDNLVADAVMLGAAGARQTGGGFGGCIVAVMESGTEDDWWLALHAKHPNAKLIV